MRAMVKNQNFHFSELQKQIGVIQARVTATEKTCAEVPGLIEYTENTDNYLQNYMPTEVYAEVHKAMQIALGSAPTKMRLDAIDYSHRRMKEAMEKIQRIGTLTQETFVKNEFNPLKLDFDAYTIRTQWEDEEKERVEKEKREKQAALNRKSSAQQFREKMFNKATLKDLAQHLESRLDAPFKKLCNKAIERNAWMKKLIQFYQEEVGSDESDSDESGSGSSDASSSGSASDTAS